MSITINGATNTITAPSGLNIAGNTAVTGSLSATGAITSNDGTVAMRAIGFVDTGYIGTTSNHPVAIQVNNSTIAAVTSSGLAVTGTLSATTCTQSGDLSAVNLQSLTNSAASYANTNNFLRFINSTGNPVGGLTHPAVTTLGLWGNTGVKVIGGSSGATTIADFTTASGLAVYDSVTTKTYQLTLNGASSQNLYLGALGSSGQYITGNAKYSSGWTIDDATKGTWAIYGVPTTGTATALNFQIGAVNTAPSTVASITSTGLTPGADNTQNFGSASLGWKELFCDNGTINTSDARRKTGVSALSTAEINAAKQLAKEIGSFKFLAAVTEKGDAARLHIGMTVQRAIEIMEGNGLDPFAYSFICHDVWDDEFVEHPAIEAVSAKEAVIDEDGNVVTPAVEAVAAVDAWTEQTKVAGDKYSFRVHELLLFMAAGFEARLAALEAA